MYIYSQQEWHFQPDNEDELINPDDEMDEADDDEDDDFDDDDEEAEDEEDEDVNS